MTENSLILLVSPDSHYPSHAWPNTVALLRALRRKGRNVQAVIFSTGTEPIPPDLQGGFKPVFSSLPGIWRRMASGKWQRNRLVKLASACEAILCLVKALRLARGHPNTVLHILGGFYWPVFLAVPRFPRVRFLFSLYGSILLESTNPIKARFRPRLKKILQRALDTGRLDFVFENDLNLQKAAPLLGSRAHLIPYAIDDGEELPSQEDSRRRLDLPPDEKILLFFGTHRQDKDYHTALKGCQALSEPPLALFVGKVISDNNPRQVAADCRYPKVRIVDEFVPDEMVKYYFAAADAVALPYEANTLVSGVVIVCCQHMRPVIASATPYLSEFVSRFNCGVTYRPGDSASFAGAAGHLLADTKGFYPGLAKAKQAHSWSTAANQYIHLYEDSTAR